MATKKISQLDPIQSGSIDLANASIPIVNSGTTFKSTPDELKAALRGASNSATGTCATVSGGDRNTASGGYSTVSGGNRNTALNTFSTVSGGVGNTALENNSTISGGKNNTVSGYYSTVGGGYGNTASGYYSTISGGEINEASGELSTIGGGQGNTASGDNSTIGGGCNNTASGEYSTIGGGYNNTVNNTNSIALGSNITSDKDNTTFVQNLHITGSTTLNGLLELSLRDPLPASGSEEARIGVIAVSGSVGASKPYFFDGTTWNSLF